MIKDIPNSKNYSVNSDGEVFKNGKKLKGNMDEYKRVSISYKTGCAKRWYIHRLVATIFIPNPDNLPEVNHKNGNKHDNRVENLEWVTTKQNAAHASRTGLLVERDKNLATVYNDIQIHEACKLLQDGWRNVDVCKKLDIDNVTVSNLRTKRQWKRIANMYSFPKRQNTLSTESVEWICKMLEDGKRHKEILEISENPLIKYQTIDRILHGRSYKSISKNFKFK